MSKRAAYQYGTDVSGKKYWRNLAEHASSPELAKALEREFPDGASELADPVSRRSFIGLMGASLGLAGLAGCRRPEEKILPYNRRPETLIPGRSMYFATAMPFAGTAIGLLVESHEGRPTKVEGNPDHPDSLGAANTFAQASVLDIYDTARARSPFEKKAAKKWSDAEAALKAAGAKAAGKAGAGLAILTEAHRSPTLAAALARFRAQNPAARVFRYDPLSQQHSRDGAKLAFGRALETSLDLTKAKVIVSIDSDFMTFEGSPIRQARAFADGRRLEAASTEMNRLYVVESAYSVTGGKADHRLRLNQREIPGFALALAKELGVDVPESKVAVSAGTAKWAKAVAADLAKHRGQSAVAVGAGQPAFVHAIGHLVNAALGNVGAAVRLAQPFDEAADGPEELKVLADALTKGEIETLVVLGGNPVYSAPGDLDFAAAMGRAGLTIHLSSHVDETGDKATWTLNRAHYLESWGDVRSADGTYSVIQPLIAPLHGGRTDAEVVELLSGGTRKAYDLVRGTFLELGNDLDGGWKRALHAGLLANSASASETPGAAPSGLAEAVAAFTPDAGWELSFGPDSHAWDGRYASNGWLHELPDQMTKLTWGNAALISPATAAREGITDGDWLEITPKGAKSFRIPALIQPGQADGSLALTLGQGRRKVGALDAGDEYTKVGVDVGSDVSPGRSVGAFHAAFGATVKKAEGKHDLAVTQGYMRQSSNTATIVTLNMTERPLAREGTLDQYKDKPTFAKELVKVPEREGKRFNLYGDFDEHKYDGHKWGMVIDLNSCIGCNACMVACQAENNIPLVGKDGVIRGREMHWLRIDRYFEGQETENPKSIMQPIGCQHCENAPCELVCPVAATSHSPEGLNDMTYNRCVGTRYCANNCPYKVRRFNFFNYQSDVPELRKMQFNPNVTVRSRGVMEKCSYCVQRIQEAKLAAKREQRERIRDGEAVSACQQTCPTGAITFGDLNDPASKVARAAASDRGYKLLEEINTRPRTSFLAAIRNPNPDPALEA